jgi:hypothetical protein
LRFRSLLARLPSFLSFDLRLRLSAAPPRRRLRLREALGARPGSALHAQARALGRPARPPVCIGRVGPGRASRCLFPSFPTGRRRRAPPRLPFARARAPRDQPACAPPRCGVAGTPTSPRAPCDPPSPSPRA